MSIVPVSRLTDLGSGHGSFPPTVVIAASEDAFANGLGIARVGDPLEPHGSPSPSPVHPRFIAVGSTTHFVNSRPCARITDAIHCGGFMMQGSPDFFSG